jgi:D-glycero-D-manno-heptose 1,7-bisphosphate phosphatase
MVGNTSPLAYGDTVGDDGIWVQCLNRGQGIAPRPTLFLDRDGVILVETHYLHTVEDTQLMPGAAATIARANALGYPVVVVTNQSGIGRGIYGWAEFARVQEKMLDDLAAEGAFVNAVMACPFHKDGDAPWNVADHPDRKPNPGMLLRAGSLLAIDYATSWIVGDHASDLAAGKAAGLAGGMHVWCGHGSHPGQREDAWRTAGDGFAVREGDSILDAPAQVPLLGASV